MNWHLSTFRPLAIPSQLCQKARQTWIRWAMLWHALLKRTTRYTSLAIQKPQKHCSQVRVRLIFRWRLKVSNANMELILKRTINASPTERPSARRRVPMDDTNARAADTANSAMSGWRSNLFPGRTNRPSSSKIALSEEWFPDNLFQALKRAFVSH